MNKDYITIPFYKNGKILENSPLCTMTTLSAGSMRFRWNEENPNRSEVFSRILGDFSLSLNTNQKNIVPIQLDHTHIVYDVKTEGDTKNLIGDGIITTNRTLIPTVTVADCVPLFLFDPVTGVFGIVHSGWKGTGIISDAIKLANKNYGANAEDFFVTIGPHIHDCCYIVNEERALYFAKNYTHECIKEVEEGVKVDWNMSGGKLYRLSLEKANLACLEIIGVKRENIFVHPECTCCNEMYGSNRRETKKSGHPDLFTVQAAFVYFQ